MSNPDWVPGVSGNPAGRKPGSKNKLKRDFHEAYEEAKRRGYTHPFLAMMEIANDMTQPVERRDGMLREAASYVCPKPRQTVAIERDVPVFTSEQQAEAFLAEFIAAIAPDLEPTELANMTRQFILSKREGKELELKANPPASQPVHVVIEGGLPVPPGYENVIMPHNGHAIEGHLVAGQQIAGQEAKSFPEQKPPPQTQDGEP
jgi:hypothetical protein